ncbi:MULTISPECIES: type III secretion system gatekeeper subunit SctW [unclassified Pantoea]|uniref:type III secretion system gatekeeper subunit SctW n=1 Tax=unclassified Pantoea TaxID=2630326 RepID=UPI001231A3C2|nr:MULTISPECIES: type III secretion system gatekeeper subunit SctW [unclassified Pantoea]KAA5969514.1 YopN family type III secretion system gatekeeper subunit [Pantoea sp. M_6]KAA5975733.1 YopN family type III secretion system gatekeeper subunit [Pantoea sp. M_8]KAA5993950.1 YopN family type III secretion system gatekeeper subunit [Pantoea sp. M_10]KAA5998938.1 YopN family type III secretion system gatekeeper subunit [Pantoea sp. M_5]
MLKIQHAIPALAHSLKALHKNTPQTVVKNSVPDNVRVRETSLNDAMEEIGAAFSEKMERKQKAQERRNASRHLQRGRHAISKVGELNALFSLLDGGDEQQTSDQMAWLRSALRQTPPPDSDTVLEKSGGDPARTALLLRMLGEQAQDEGDRELATQAGAQLESLQKSHGQTIRAGNNTASAIAGYTRDPQRKQSLRDLYYDGIVHQQSATMMLDMLLERMGSRHLQPTLRTLQRALADDIAALAPSISVTALCRIQRSLRDAAGISQTLSDSQVFLQRMRSRVPDVAMNSLTLARRMLQISHNGAWQSDFNGLAEEIVGQETHHRPLFFSSLFPLLYGVPPSLWHERENRDNALKLLRSIITDVNKTEQQQQRRNRTAAS